MHNIPKTVISLNQCFATMLLLLCLTCMPLGFAQTTVSPQNTNPSAVVIGSVNKGIAWSSLSKQKQESLVPLQNIWPMLSEAHQRKWLTLAQNFPKMSPQEQEKLHSRMVDWAALNPKEREQARLNFAETKKLTPEERTATWEAYQALSPEARQELATKALSKKGKSGASSIKPSKKPKLIAIPPRRVPPDSLKDLVTKQNPIDPKSLLPVQHSFTEQPR